MKAGAQKKLDKSKNAILGVLAKARRAPKEIKSAQDAEVIAEILGAVSTARKDYDQERKDTTQALRDETTEINREFEEILNPLKGVEEALKAMVVQWDEQEELRVAREAKEAADEAAKQQADEDVKAEEEDRPPELVTQREVSKAGPIRTASGTAGTRKNWTFEVEDIDKVPRKYLILDETMVRGIAKAEKEKAKIPGIRFYAERKATTRR